MEQSHLHACPTATNESHSEFGKPIVFSILVLWVELTDWNKSQEHELP